MAKKSKGSPLTIVFILLFIILLIGGGIGAAVYMHMVKIPGLEFIAKLSETPKDLKTVSKKEDKTKTSIPSVTKKEDKPKISIPSKPTSPPTDLKKGAKQTAKLWNQIETKKLVDIVKTWSNPDLARVVMQMETGQASALLEALEPSRSAELSKIIQKESSQLPPDSATSL